MKKILLIAVLFTIIPLSAGAEPFETDGVETHIGVNTGLFLPWHHNGIGYGYGFNLVMRPSSAKYLYDELEQLNLGIAIQSTSQYVAEGFAFSDLILSVRYYMSRENISPGWESAFIGAGIGIATVAWDTESDSGKLTDTDFLLEAGYEFDLKNLLQLPLVMMISFNYRMIDIEPVSYTGVGAALSFSYGIDQ